MDRILDGVVGRVVGGVVPRHTVNEHIRQRLLAAVPDPPKPQPSVADIVAEDWSWPFIQHCLNRIIMGRFRYGKASANGAKYDRIGGIRRRLELYQSTGNLEYLVDIANLAQLEFQTPSIDGADFRATDDGEHVALKAHA